MMFRLAEAGQGLLVRAHADLAHFYEYGVYQDRGQVSSGYNLSIPAVVAICPPIVESAHNA